MGITAHFSHVNNVDMSQVTSYSRPMAEPNRD